MSCRPNLTVTKPSKPIGKYELAHIPWLLCRVTWGPSLDAHLNLRAIQRMADPQPRLNPTAAETKVLRSVRLSPPRTLDFLPTLLTRVFGETSLLLESLAPGTVYIVKVQSMLLRGSQQETFRVPQLRSGNSALSHGQDRTRSMPSGRQQLKDDNSFPASLQVSEEAYMYIQTPTLSEGRLGSLRNAAASPRVSTWILSLLFLLVGGVADYTALRVHITFDTFCASGFFKKILRPPKLC
ncbi:unnamed protein product [Dibothriocephalus latus]|uniref:Uncharacterized protein n=1 Tax=Dibothriocephalus latus TaxID=60516 RepID=A0A3P6SNF0_DIBLA|nr:unnamed protein product [Dibothriocephalus latus]